MKKVFQRKVTKGDGDCMQAVCASLFELEIDKVPDFIEEEYWFTKMIDFYKERGFTLTPFNPWNKNKDIEFVSALLKHDGGVNGFFEGTVLSQTFKDGTHAVVVDVSLNIVHDPNPNQLALKLKPEDVISVMTAGDDWHISVEGKLIKEKFKGYD